MAVTYSSTLVYCAEADVERYSVYDWTASSSPNDAQVYDFAQDVAASVEVKTEQAGNRITPTASLTEAVRVQRVLEQANAVGAAMLARHAVYIKSGSERDLRIWESLARQYEALMGEGSSGGGTMAGIGDGGLVEDTVSSAANTGLLANEITEGHISLPTIKSREQDIDFTTEDVD